MTAGRFGNGIALRGWVRIVVRTIVMVGWLGIALTCYHLCKLIGGINPWPRRFLGGIARIAGVRVTATGRPAAGRAC